MYMTILKLQCEELSPTFPDPPPPVHFCTCTDARRPLKTGLPGSASSTEIC